MPSKSIEALANAFQNDVARVEIRSPNSIIIYERKTRKKWEKVRYDSFGRLKEREKGILGIEVWNDLIGCLIAFNKAPYITGPQGKKNSPDRPNTRSLLADHQIIQKVFSIFVMHQERY